MQHHGTDINTDGYYYSSHAVMSDCAQARINDFYELIYVTNGEFRYAADDAGQRATKGDLIFTVPDEPHSFTLSDDSTFTCRIFRFRRSFITGTFPDLFTLIDKETSHASGVIGAELAGKYGIDVITAQIHQYAVSKKDEADFMILLLTAQLVTKIGEILKYERAPDAQTNKNIQKITEYINANLTEPLNLNAIAQYMYLDKSYICRLFKSETGLTINTYINMRRVAMAKDLIASGLSPNAAYKRCGYNDYSTFFRSFRRYALMTPEEFKNLQKN